MLQQAYVSYYFNVLNGLTVNMGKMATHIGFELLESMNNPTYSIGSIFQYTIPFIHTGVCTYLGVIRGLDLGFFIYNSAAGTGHTNPATNTSFDANGQQSGGINNTAQSYYFDGLRQTKAIGTQITLDSGIISESLADKVTLKWNILRGHDNTNGVVDPTKQYVANKLADQYGVQRFNLTAGPSNNDYWFINHVNLIVNPVQRLTFIADWTFGENGGSNANNSQMITQANTLATQYGYTYSDEENATYMAEKVNRKSIYQAYGFWTIVQILDFFSVAFRLELLDDSRNQRALAAGPVQQGNTFVDRSKTDYIVGTIIAQNPGLAPFQQQVSALVDKNYKIYNTGYYRTFSVVPTLSLFDHLLVKWEFRADWASGQQFVNQNGDRKSYQLGTTLGVVTKF